MKKLSLEELLDLEVTSVSRRAQKLSETASAIQVISGEDIRRAGAASLPEALRLASNLGVAQVDSRQWAVSARGFNNTSANKQLVLIDGRTIYTPLHAAVFWDVQDTFLEDIDRIEVISGPGGALWGSNAVNGVINITTKSARDTQGLIVLGGGGTELRGFGGARYGGSLGPNLHYRVYGKYFERDSTVRPSGATSINDWHMGQGGFRLDWDASAGDLLTLQGDVYEGRISQPARADISVTGGNALGRWSHTISADSDFKLQWYVDRTNRRIPGSFAEGLTTYDVDFQHRFALSAQHDIVWGLGYRLIDNHTPNDYPVLAFFPSRVKREWFSAFAQDEIALVKDRLHLTLGAKVEHNDYTGAEYQPNARLAWMLNERQTLWVAVSRAVRTPSRIDGELFAPRDPPFFLQGNPDFASEELLAWELGYRMQPLPQLSLSLATFYNDYDDLRSTERLNPPAPLPIFLGNGRRGESYGAELTADWRVTQSWRLRAGYTHLDLDIRPKPGSTDTSFGSSEANDPKHQFLLRSSLDLPGHWECDAAYRFVARIANQRVPAYDELDVRLGWRPTPALELSIVGQSLLHDRHAEFGAAASRHEIERAVYGKVVWHY